MDEINDFFDFSKTFERKSVPVGCISGSAAATAGISREVRMSTEREYLGNGYAMNVIERERIKLEKVINVKYNTQCLI